MTKIFSVVAKTSFYRPLVNYKSQLLRLLTFQRLFLPFHLRREMLQQYEYGCCAVSYGPILVAVSQLI